MLTRGAGPAAQVDVDVRSPRPLRSGLWRRGRLWRCAKSVRALDYRSRFSSLYWSGDTLQLALPTLQRLMMSQGRLTRRQKPDGVGCAGPTERLSPQLVDWRTQRVIIARVECCFTGA